MNELIPLIREFRSALDPRRVFQNIYRLHGKAVFLDSIEYRLPDQRFSYLATDPAWEIVLDSRGLRLRKAPFFKEPTPFLARTQLIPFLRKTLARHRLCGASAYPFFVGGLMGYLGYELAEIFEPKIHFRPKPGPDYPTLYLAFFRQLIVFDHVRQRYFLITYEQRGKRTGEGEETLKRMKAYFQAPAGYEKTFRLKSFRSEMTQAAFERMVRRAKAYISQGDIYQVNLSQRFLVEIEGAPWVLYERLRHINPSPFASFLKLDDLHILSSSPERLIRRKGRRCETKPIAGTYPRFAAGRRTEQLERELLASEKERAEHIMLVDLERNDLGRVSDWRSVRVQKMMEVEKYSHVLHIVSTITGTLLRDKDSLDLLQAMFPGGTITGCPKIRCMEIIDELEPVRRGLYTGSIGYLDFRGDIDFNIVIRTLILQKNKGHLQVGAGIVYDSDPRREYEETLHKGEALALALLEAGTATQGSLQG